MNDLTIKEANAIEELRLAVGTDLSHTQAVSVPVTIRCNLHDCFNKH